MIKNATFTSVWDGGVAVSSNCKVDTDTKEVFDIEPGYTAFDVLSREYITLEGADFPVSPGGCTEFWYA